jgi:hypothetical protein
MLHARTRRIHRRFKALVARAILRADAADVAHLAVLKPRREPRRGRRRGGPVRAFGRLTDPPENAA